jgi:predicted RNA-binding protein with TRAM domain
MLTGGSSICDGLAAVDGFTVLVTSTDVKSTALFGQRHTAGR